MKPAFRIGLAAAALLLAAPGAGPLTAAPVIAPILSPGFICHARIAAPDLAWAEAIDTAPAGRIVRAAASAISRTDQAALLFKLGLLQGHLMIGRTLIEANQASLALPHFGHPVRELYAGLAPDIARRGMTPFDGELVALEALAAGKPGDPAMIAQYDKVIRILDALRATVPSELRDDPRFTLRVLGEIAGGAAEDYAESVEGKEITKPVEYHDARGYLMYAQTELDRIAARPGVAASARFKAAAPRFEALRTVTAPLLPPKTPLKTPAQFKAMVDQYKQAAAANPA